MENKKKGVVPKTVFPSLLKETLNLLAAKMPQNIKAGFESTGIIPINSQKVLTKLITTSQTTNTLEQQALVDSFDHIMVEKTKVKDNQRPKRN